MSLFRIKKQEDKIQKKVRNLAYLKENKKCFDCPTKSPFFVNTTNYTFICGRCSGLVREVGHRVKSIATSKFNGPEYLSLKYGGNCIARKVWLHDFPEDYEPQDHHQIRTFIHQKYREKRWLDKESLLSHTNQLKQIISLSYTEDGRPLVIQKQRSFLSGFVRIPTAPKDEIPELTSRSSMESAHSSSDDSVKTIEDKNQLFGIQDSSHYQVTPNKALKSTSDTFNKFIQDLSGIKMYTTHKAPYDPYSSFRGSHLNKQEFNAIVQPPQVVQSASSRCYHNRMDLFRLDPKSMLRRY